MVLNSHTPYDDPSDEEEEWEFLNSDDTTPNDLQLEVAEQPPPIAATPVDATNATDMGLEPTDDGSKHDVRSTDDAISNTEHYVAEEAAIMEDKSLENRQDESETNSGASTAGRNNDVVSSEVMVEAEQQPLEEEDTSSVTSGGTPRNSEEEDSAPPPQQQQHQHTPNNTNDHPLRNTWNFLENTFQGIDNQHQLRRRTSNSVKHINQSMQNLFSNITDETQRVRDQADVHARNASTHVSQAASSARESISRANAEYKLSEKVATVAVIGGATLLALGNPRAGVTALAVAGASLAVGEVTSANYEESPHSREEYGLPEGVHID